MPDYRIASYAGEGENTENYTLAVNNNQFSASSGRFYSNMSETILSGTANYILPFRYKFTKMNLKRVYFHNYVNVILNLDISHISAHGALQEPLRKI